MGRAFDYIARAQIASWSRDPVEKTMPWLARIGLGRAAGLVPFGEAVPYEFDALYGLGAETRELLAEAWPASPGAQLAEVFRRYQHGHDSWCTLIRSGDVDRRSFAVSAVHLGRLEGLTRGDRVTLDILLAEPAAEVVDNLIGLWSVLERDRPFFDQFTTRVYNPSFGVATKLLQGADADIVLDGLLLDFKTTRDAGYDWTDAAQLVGYFVLAAMEGKPWPIERVAMYQVRLGRILFVEAIDLKTHFDLLALGLKLIQDGPGSTAAAAFGVRALGIESAGGVRVTLRLRRPVFWAARRSKSQTRGHDLFGHRQSRSFYGHNDAVPQSGQHRDHTPRTARSPTDSAAGFTRVAANRPSGPARGSRSRGKCTAPKRLGGGHLAQETAR